MLFTTYLIYHYISQFSRVLWTSRYVNQENDHASWDSKSTLFSVKPTWARSSCVPRWPLANQAANHIFPSCNVGSTRLTPTKIMVENQESQHVWAHSHAYLYLQNKQQHWLSIGLEIKAPSSVKVFLKSSNWLWSGKKHLTGSGFIYIDIHKPRHIFRYTSKQRQIDR